MFDWKVEQIGISFSKESTKNGQVFIGDFRSENFLRYMDEDVLNPEVKMNREYYNYENSWDYWYIYSINSITIEIKFPFSKNN